MSAGPWSRAAPIFVLAFLEDGTVPTSNWCGTSHSRNPLRVAARTPLTFHEMREMDFMCMSLVV